MRTTITLAPDVFAAVDALRRESGAGVSEVVNDVLRQGLAARTDVRPFRQARSDMGLPRLSIDDIGGLLDILEGDDRRS